MRSPGAPSGGDQFTCWRRSPVEAIRLRWFIGATVAGAIVTAAESCSWAPLTTTASGPSRRLMVRLRVKLYGPATTNRVEGFPGRTVVPARRRVLPAASASKSPSTISAQPTPTDPGKLTNRVGMKFLNQAGYFLSDGRCRPHRWLLPLSLKVLAARGVPVFEVRSMVGSRGSSKKK